MRSSLPGICMMALWTALLWPYASLATPATAGEWYADCEAYIAVLSGTGDADDLELTYCMGQTIGLVSGLETGTRIGAVSMASMLTVLLGLDGDKVLQLLGETSDEELLRYCAPDDLSTSQAITLVADFLGQHPDKTDLPVTAVFFEALQDRYPCEAETASRQDSDASSEENEN